MHENRIRQAASSLGAATFCVTESGEVRPRAQAAFGEALSQNQGGAVPACGAGRAMRDAVRTYMLRKTAWETDQMAHPELEKNLSDMVSMCNFPCGEPSGVRGG